MGNLISDVSIIFLGYLHKINQEYLPLLLIKKCILF